ncbi:MAG: hypothetical protein WEF99_16475 [Thermoanaerobaculia bacterium]
MRRKSPLGAVGALLAAAVLLAAPDLLPDRLAEVSRQVEEVRGRKFLRPVPASEIDPAQARRVLREKIVEGLPAPPDDAFRSLAALGLIDDATGMLDILVDFYASQVVAFYDPQPRRFYVVKGAEGLGEAGEEAGDMAAGLIYSHELTHALQDESLRLDERIRQLRDDGDRAFALQSLLEGEATLVMVRVALAGLPGADESLEDQIAPLLSAGALERANVPKDVPDYFVDQLFFPYTEGTAFARAALKRGGWEEMDRLWKNPPLSSAEILHGSPYPAPAQGLIPANLASIAPGQRFVYADTLGEWTLRFLLGRALGQDEAARAAAGWRGDRIAYFAGPGAMSYLWRIRFDEPAAAARFEAALRKARAKRPAPAAETITRKGADVVVSSGLANRPPETNPQQ